MARRHHYRRLKKEAPELNITTFLNLMVVLVPFLLITAVFSRIAILELNVPTGGAGSGNNEEQLVIEVIVREGGLELGNGKQVLAQFPKLNENKVKLFIDDEGKKDYSKLYDLKNLSRYLIEIKTKYPEKTDALVLMEPNIEYRVLVTVMDTVRSSFVKQIDDETGGTVYQQAELFPDISIGDAP